MLDLAHDEDGDLDLTGGDLNLIDGPEAVIQDVVFAIRMLRGEWFLDVTEGVDYDRLCWDKATANFVALRRDILRTVRNRPGVLSVDLIDFDSDEELSELNVIITFQVVDGDAPVTIEEDILP